MTNNTEARAREVAIALVTIERAEHHLPPCDFDMLTDEDQERYLHRADAVMPILSAYGNERAAQEREACAAIAQAEADDIAKHFPGDTWQAGRRVMAETIAASIRGQS